MADAAGIASTAMTQFKLSGKDIPHVADLLAAGAGKAMGGVDDLGMALKQGGLVASQFGLSIEETVGGLAAFASAGLLGSDAGTSLKTMLLALANPTGKSKQLLDELGISAYDAQGQFVGLEGLAGQLKAGMEGLTDAQRQQALATIFGTDAIRPASILYEQGAEGIRSWTEAVDDAGYAAETAATLQDNLVGDLEKLGGSWSTLAITMGEVGDGPLRSAVQGLTGLLDAAAESPAAAQAIFGVAAGLGGLALGAAALMKGVTFVSEFRGAVAALSDTYPGVERLSGGLGKVAKAAGAAALVITVLQAAKAIGDTFHETAADADEAAAAIIRAYTATGDGAATAAQRVGALDAAFQRADGSAYIDRIGQKVDSLDTALARYADRGWKYADGLDAALAPIVGSESVISGLTTQFGLLDQELSKLTMGQSTDVFAGIAEKATAVGMGVEDLITLFPDYAAQVQQLAAVNGLGELSAADLAAAMAGTYEPLIAAQQAMGDTTTAAAAQEGAYDAAAASAEQLAAAQQEAADAARDALDAYQAELDAIASLNDAQTGAANTQLAAERAADSYRDKLDKISKTLKENGNSFDETTEKGRANREALRDLASSARSTTDAMLANGDSVDTVNGKMKTQRDEFIKVATAAGIPKKAAKDLADAYGLIPNYVETTVATPGAKMSKQEADNLNEALEGLPDDVKTSIIALANTHGVDVAKAALASVKDKTVTVRINTVGGGGAATRHQAVATGGILEYYAAGGFSRAGDFANAHQPTILPAGTNRLFAEPETGGEAYIPLADDWRRPRAESILATVADRFGLQLVKDVAAFAGGGVMLPTAAQSATLAGLQIGVMPVAQLNAFAAALQAATLESTRASIVEGRVAEQQAAKVAKAAAALEAVESASSRTSQALTQTGLAWKTATEWVTTAEKQLAAAKTGTKKYRAAEKTLERAKVEPEALVAAEKALKAASKAVDPRSDLGKMRTELRDLKRTSTAGLSKDQKAARSKEIETLQKRLDRAEDKRNLRIAEARDRYDFEKEKYDNKVAAAQKKLDKESAKRAESIAAAEKALERAKTDEKKWSEKDKAAKEKHAAAVKAAEDKLAAAKKAEADANAEAAAKAKEMADAQAAAARELEEANKRLADAARGLSEQYVGKWLGSGGGLTDLLASAGEGATFAEDFERLIQELRDAGLDETVIQEAIRGQGEVWGAETAREILAGGKPAITALNEAAERLGKAADKLGMTQAIGAKTYADGGLETHEAMIGTGITRVWDEPETGGEAYIPLAASKRARSLAIWAETGRRLGAPVRHFADGAIVPAGASFARTPTTQTITYQVTQHNQVTIPHLRDAAEVAEIFKDWGTQFALA